MKQITLCDYIKCFNEKPDKGTAKILKNGQVYWEVNGQPYWSIPKAGIQVIA